MSQKRDLTQTESPKLLKAHEKDAILEVAKLRLMWFGIVKMFLEKNITRISTCLIIMHALYTVFCTLISPTTESRSVSVRKRCINENTSVLFLKAISSAPSISADFVDFLLDSINGVVFG